MFRLFIHIHIHPHLTNVRCSRSSFLFSFNIERIFLYTSFVLPRVATVAMHAMPISVQAYSNRCIYVCDSLHGIFGSRGFFFRFRFPLSLSLYIHCFIEIWLAMHIRCQYPVKISCCAVQSLMLVALFSHRASFSFAFDQCVAEPGFQWFMGKMRSKRMN